MQAKKYDGNFQIQTNFWVKIVANPNQLWAKIVANPNQQCEKLD